MKNVVFFDLDNVLIKGQTQKHLLHYLYKNKKISSLFFLRIAFWFLLYRFRLVHDVIRIREFGFSIFKGWSLDKKDKFFDDFHAAVVRKSYLQESMKILKGHLERNDEVVLISASLTEIVSRVAKEVGVKSIIATDLKDADGILTGEISGSVPYGESKLSLIRNFIKKMSDKNLNTYAYADHISDLSVLDYVNCPVAINPDKSLRRIARIKKWAIYDF